MLRMRMQPDDTFAADLVGLVGAVDAIERVAVALIEVERAGAERIVRSAAKAAGGGGGAQVRPALQHVGGRHPARPLGLALHGGVPVQPKASEPVATP